VAGALAGCTGQVYTSTYSMLNITYSISFKLSRHRSVWHAAATDHMYTSIVGTIVACMVLRCRVSICAVVLHADAASNKLKAIH
jgi:hypothetical protein